MRPDNIITLSLAIGFGAATICIARNVLADLWRAMFPRRNRRLPGYWQAIETGLTMRRHEMASDASRRGWQTRRKRIAAERRSQMNADIDALQNAQISGGTPSAESDCCARD